MATNVSFNPNTKGTLYMTIQMRTVRKNDLLDREIDLFFKNIEKRGFNHIPVTFTSVDNGYCSRILHIFKI